MLETGSRNGEVERALVVVLESQEAVNEAAMTAAYNDVPISQKILVDVLKYKNPTYSTKTRIGFNKN